MKTRLTIMAILVSVAAAVSTGCLQYPDKYPNPDGISDASDVNQDTNTDTRDDGGTDTKDDGSPADVPDTRDGNEPSDTGDHGQDTDVGQFCVVNEPCDDGDGCTINDTCSEAGDCVGTVVSGCDDSLECTDDSCVSDTDCSHELKTGFCLVDGVCYAADAVDLVKFGPCLACKPAVARNEFSPDDSLTCSDNSDCTEADHCLGGVCTGNQISCDDSKVCTDDSCVAETGCVHTNNTVQCNPARCEGLMYYAPAVCADGLCPSVTPENCDDGNPCTTDACKTTGCTHSIRNGQQCAAGRCEMGTFYAPAICINDYCPPQDSTFCDDGKVCTEDYCTPEGGCLARPVSGTVTCGEARCEGNTFVPKVVCSAGNCPLPVPVNCNDGNVCTDDTCETTGCKNVANNGPCSDGNLCTEDDKCLNRACKAGSAKNCSDGLDCTIDTCVQGTGLCQHTSPGYCVIEGQCYFDGESDTANVCRACITSVASDVWTPSNNGYPCDDYEFGDASCAGGECVRSCDMNRGDCDTNPENGCESNLLNDPEHCSDCETDCGSQVCSWGICADQCAGDLELCSGRCEDVKTSLDNCGDCGIPCQLPNAAEKCLNGICTLDGCDSGYVDVDKIRENGCECRNTGWELCNLKDDDCNGFTDDVDVGSLQSDPDNCGLCGRVCNSGDKTVYGFCTGGSCYEVPCDANFWDIDKKPSTGCEYFCVQQGIDACGNGLDEDCSGLPDEGC